MESASCRFQCAQVEWGWFYFQLKSTMVVCICCIANKIPNKPAAIIDSHLIECSLWELHLWEDMILTSICLNQWCCLYCFLGCTVYLVERDPDKWGHYSPQAMHYFLHIRKNIGKVIWYVRKHNLILLHIYYIALSLSSVFFCAPETYKYKYWSAWRSYFFLF